MAGTSRSSISNHRLRAIRRAPLLAVALALLIGAAEPTATRAAPATASQSYSLRATPASLDLCVGQSVTVQVTASLNTRRTPRARPARQAARDGWLTVDPGGTIASVSAPPGGPPPSSFTVTGVSQGAQHVHIDYYSDDPELAPLVGPAATRRAGALVLVTVRDPCYFYLTVKSEGTRRKGFVERMTSTLTAAITPDPTTGEFSQDVPVANRITQTRRINCATSVTASASEATVEGKLDPRTGILRIKVSYSDIQAVNTTVVCPRGSAGSPGSASPEPFEPNPIDISVPNALATLARGGQTRTFPHTVYTDIRIVNRGTYTIVPY